MIDLTPEEIELLLIKHMRKLLQTKEGRAKMIYLMKMEIGVVEEEQYGVVLTDSEMMYRLLDEVKSS